MTENIDDVISKLTSARKIATSADDSTVKNWALHRADSLSRQAESRLNEMTMSQQLAMLNQKWGRS